MIALFTNLNRYFFFTPFRWIGDLFNSNTISIMGKASSMWGKTTGKVGGLVYASSGGEQIVREYNPNVANPSTEAQVNQRARMKLMSQLSAALAPVIVMRKDGLVSKRNQFVKANFGSSYASDGIAQISYENVQLTSGNAGLPMLRWIVDTNETTPRLKTYFNEAPSANISRIVYCLFQKTDEGKLAFVTSKIISTKGPDIEDAYFAAYFAEVSTDDTTHKLSKNYVVYAYGMSDTSQSASTRYGNLNVQSATDIARLVATRTISYEDFQFTQTRGASANSGEGESETVPDGYARVFVTALGDGGTVSGGGTFEIGTSVTVVATPSSSYSFRAWVKNGTSQVVSTSASYTFTLNEQTDLLATFDFVGNESL